MTGRADYLSLGEWNVACAECGRKRKNSDMRQLPPGPPGAGMWVCFPEHWNARQPQDFVRGVPDHMAPPYVQDESDTYTTFCSTVSGIATYAIASCAIADNTAIPDEGAL